MMQLKAIYFRIIKNKKIKIAVLAILIMFLAGFLWVWISVGDLKSVEARAGFLRKNPVATKLLPVYWQIRKFSDIIYLPYYFKREEQPTYELEISKESLQIMNDSLPEGFMNVLYTDKVYVPAKFYFGGREYDAEVRYRGDNAIHWNALKRSYHIRFGKKDLFDGFREIAFIIVDDRKFAVEHLNNYRADKFGLHYPESDFANLSVNGEKGLYFVIEGWSDELLDKWNLPKGSALYGVDDPGTAGGEGLWSGVSGWKISAESGKSDEFEPLKRLLDLLGNAEKERFEREIFEIVDKDNFYAWQVHQELANSAHQHRGNRQMYFDADKNKFFFVPWDVGVFGLEEEYNFGTYGPLAERIFENPDFLQEKNRRLWEYVSDEKNLEDDLAFYDSAYERIKVSLYRDRIKIFSNRYADNFHEERRQWIIDIFREWRKRLENNDEL